MTEANFLQALGWAILNSLWQLALLWVIYQVCTAIYPSARPHFKSRLASSLLFSGFGWFIYTLALGLQAGSAANEIIGFSAPNSSFVGSVNNLIRLSLPYASIIYLALLIIPVLRFTKNYRYVQVISKNGLSKIDADWRLFVNKVASHMGVKRTIQVWVSEWVNSPVTIGFLKPIILVPMAAVNHLSTSQMEAILLHEISHIRRMDYLLNLLMNLVKVVLYFNPFAKAFIRIVETEREKSCDQMVLQFQYDTHDYASALLTLEKVSRRHQVLVVAASGNTDLLSRVEMMLGMRKENGFTVRKAMAMITGLMCVVCINALMLVMRTENDQQKLAYVAPAMTEGADGRNMNALVEHPEQIIANAIRQSSTTPISTNTTNTISKSNNIPAPPPAPADPGFIAASFELPVAQAAALTKDQEAQVKEAMEASRKLAENVQWMQVERSLADVFTEQEKQELKNEWKKEMDKYDWKKWENKLRTAYAQVDWNKVNVQLSQAMNQIHMDSLINVYSHSMAQINNMQKELCEDSLYGIPDTDITVKALAEKQRQLEKAMRQLKQATNRKIIKL